MGLALFYLHTEKTGRFTVWFTQGNRGHWIRIVPKVEQTRSLIRRLKNFAPLLFNPDWLVQIFHQ